MNLHIKNFKNLFIFITIPVLISNCADNNEPSIKNKPGELIWGVEELPNSLNPLLPLNPTGWAMKELLFDGLTNRNIGDEGDVITTLALAFDIIQQPDKKSYIVKLRNAKFHNGMPVTVKDVVFSVNAIMERKNQNPLYGKFVDLLSRVDIISQTELTFIFKKRVPIYVADQFLSFKIIPSTYKGINLNTDLRYGPLEMQFSRAPVGTGPMSFKSWDPGDNVVLIRNESYFGKYPKIRGIRAVLFHDEDKRVKYLIDGKINFLLDVSPSHMIRLQHQGLNKYEYVPYYYYAIAYQISLPKLSNPKLRRALSQAIDKSSIVKNIIGTEYNSDRYINSGPFPHNTFDAYKFPDPLAFNFDEAAKVLDKSGLARVGLVLTISSDLGSIGLKIAKLYAEMLTTAGVKTEIKEIPKNIFMNQVLPNREFEAVLLKYEGFTKRYNIAQMYYSFSNQNYAGLQLPNLDELLSRWEQTTLMEKKTPMSKKIHTILTDESAYTYLFTLPKFSSYNKNIFNVTIDEISPFATIEEWEIQVQR